MGCGPSVPKDEELKKLLKTDKVILFAKSTCPYSDFVKHMMKETGQEFTVIEIDNYEVKPETLMNLIRYSGNKTVPQVYVNGKYVGGMLKIDKLRDKASMDQGKGKIVGGDLAKEGEFPFMVSLQWKNRKHFCGGNLIKYDLVFTACHCMCSFRTGEPFMFLTRDIIATAGMNNNQDEDQQVEEVVNSTRHPKCNIFKHGYVFDYGKYQLKRPFLQFFRGKHISTMPIYSTNPVEIETKLKEMVYKSEVCVSTGWGATKMIKNQFSEKYIPSKVSKNLKIINITLISIHDCRELLCKPPIESCLDETEFASRNQVCTMGPSMQDVCNGDSGGPLICKGFVFAILSWGPACGEYPYPSMFSSIHPILKDPFSSSSCAKLNASFMVILTLLCKKIMILIK